MIRVVIIFLFRFFGLMFCYAVLFIAVPVSFVSSRGQYLRWLVLGSLGMRKVDAGALEKAKRFGNELLSIARDYKDDWNYGNALHKGNLILGRVALREGDPETAKYYLLCAGKTPGSPQLESFGPNMTLAKELLETGDAEAVLEYIKLCRSFWSMGFRRLTRWEEMVRIGRIPNFGAHLFY